MITASQARENSLTKNQLFERIISFLNDLIIDASGRDVAQKVHYFIPIFLLDRVILKLRENGYKVTEIAKEYSSENQTAQAILIEW